MHKTRTLKDELALLGLDQDAIMAASDLPVEALTEPFMDLELEPLTFDLDVAGMSPTEPPPVEPAPVGASTKSVRTTIRLPNDVLAELKRRAAADGKRYQTMLVRALRDWLNAPGPANPKK